MFLVQSCALFFVFGNLTHPNLCPASSPISSDHFRPDSLPFGRNYGRFTLGLPKLSATTTSRSRAALSKEGTFGGPNIVGPSNRINAAETGRTVWCRTDLDHVGLWRTKEVEPSPSRTANNTPSAITIGYCRAIAIAIAVGANGWRLHPGTRGQGLHHRVFAGLP